MHSCDAMALQFSCCGKKENRERNLEKASLTYRGGITAEMCSVASGDSNPPTCTSQWGLCSGLGEGRLSQAVVGVPFSSTLVDWADFQRDPDVYVYSSERSKSRKSILSCYWRTYSKVLCVVCPLWLDVDRDVGLYLFRTASSFVDRKTKSYLFLIPRGDNCLGILCSVIRKVFILKMEPFISVTLCGWFCMSSPASGKVGLDQAQNMGKSLVLGSENYLSLYRTGVNWQPAEISCLWCHLSWRNRLPWHFSVSQEC